MMYISHLLCAFHWEKRKKEKGRKIKRRKKKGKKKNRVKEEHTKGNN